MENEAQPLTPITQPIVQSPIPVQTTTNKSNLLKILLFAILGLLFLAGAVYAGIQIGKNQTPNQQPIVTQPTTSPTQTAVNPTNIPVTPSPTTDPTADWKTYTNNLFGFSFKYPTDFSLNDSLQTSTDPSSWNTHKILILKNTEKQCNFSLMVNPDGFGPFFPNKFLTLSYISNNGLVISKEEPNTENLTPETYSLIASGTFTQKITTGLLIFSDCPNNESSRNYLDNLLKQIFSTFEFTN